jgi:hypothetical protein
MLTSCLATQGRGKLATMKIRKLLNRSLRHEDDDVQVAGGVNAVVSANVNEPGSRVRASSRQRQRIVQREGRTIVESEETEQESSDSAAGD